MLLNDERVIENTSEDTRPGKIRDIKRFVLEHNRMKSDEYCNASLARGSYRAQHPTSISAFKCMDGRLDLSVVTQTPVGIIEPFRNIGSKFDLAWPFLQKLVRDWVYENIPFGRDCIALSAYHFSKGETHRGCAGFGYNTENAMAASQRLVGQFDYMFGRPQVYPILLGIETDEGGLLFHGDTGEVFVVGDNLDMGHNQLHEEFSRLYPSMRDQARSDLLELVMGNQRYIKMMRSEAHRPIGEDHREQILSPGRGTDWLHYPNLALIIGPYDPKIAQAIATGGSIILKNIREGRVDADAGRLLLVPKLAKGGYKRPEWKGAELSARHFTDMAYEVLKESVPELLDDNFSIMTAVVDGDTRLLHVLD